MNKTIKEMHEKISRCCDLDFEKRLSASYYIVFLCVAFAACLICTCYFEEVPRTFIRFKISVILLSVAILIFAVFLCVLTYRLRSLRNYTLAVYDRLAFRGDPANLSPSLTTQLHDINRKMNDIAEFNRITIYKEMQKVLKQMRDIRDNKDKQHQDHLGMFYILTRSMLCPDQESLHKFIELCSKEISILNLPDAVKKYLSKRSIRTIGAIITHDIKSLKFREPIEKALMAIHPGFELYMLYPDQMRDVLFALMRTDYYTNELLMNNTHN